MNEEIKEILDKFDKVLENYELDKKTKQFTVDSICHLFPSEMIIVKDYITNLQQENEELRQEDRAWHQILKEQNKREYRSKFLKDFQEEYGENVYPDYDEIYKRYDDYKSRCGKAIEILNNIYMLDNVTITNNACEKIDNAINILQNGSDE